MTNGPRTRRFAVLVALFAALSLGACQCGPPAQSDGGVGGGTGGGGGGGTGGGAGGGMGGGAGGGTGGGAGGGTARLTPALEVLPAAGRVSAGSRVFEVQLGQPISQQPASGGSRTIEGNSAVKP